MQVKNGLTDAPTGINGQPVSGISEIQTFRYQAGGQQQVAGERFIRGGHVVERIEMLFGQHQQVGWREGVDIADDQALVIFIEDIRGRGFGDDLAKDAVGHKKLWLQVPCPQLLYSNSISKKYLEH